MATKPMLSQVVDRAVSGDAGAGVVLLEALACFQAGQTESGMSCLQQLQRSSGLGGLIDVLCPDLAERSDQQAQRIRRLIDVDGPRVDRSPGAAAADRLNENAEASAVELNRAILTCRQQAVLAYVQKGLTNSQIAKRMRVSPNTVKWHPKETYHRLGVGNRCAALHVAVAHELI